MKMLMIIMAPTVIFLSLLQILIVSGTYVISYPTYVASNVPTTFCISVLNTNQSAVEVTAALSNQDKVLGSGSVTIAVGTNGILTIPAVPVSAYDTNLTLTMNGTTANGVMFSWTKLLKVDYRSPSIFIQTDTDSYNAGQQVNLRVISVYSNQQPYQGIMNITILDSKNRSMQQWTGEQSVLGVISKQFQLSTQPPTGVWTIKVANNESVEIVKYFTVAEKVSQAFTVTVAAPSTYIALKKQSLTGNITALDTNGKAVKGTAEVTIRAGIPYNFYNNPQGFMHYSDYSFIKQNVTVTKTFTITGSEQFSFTSDDVERCLNTSILSLYVSNNTYIAASLNVTVVVTETISGTARNGSAFVTLTPNAYKLQFSDYSRTFKPSLNHTTRLKVIRSDQTQITASDMKVPVVVVIQQYPSVRSQVLSRIARSVTDFPLSTESQGEDINGTADYTSSTTLAATTTAAETNSTMTNESTTATSDTADTTAPTSVADTSTMPTTAITAGTTTNTSTAAAPMTVAGTSTTTTTTSTTAGTTTNTSTTAAPMTVAGTSTTTTTSTTAGTTTSTLTTQITATGTSSTTTNNNTSTSVLVTTATSASSTTFLTTTTSTWTSGSSLATTASTVRSQTFYSTPYSSVNASVNSVSTSFPTSAALLSFISTQTTGFTLSVTPATACTNLPAEVACQIMTFSVPVDGNIDINFPVRSNTTAVYIQAVYQGVQAWQWFNDSYAADTFIQIRKPTSILMVGSPFDVVFDATEQKNSYFYMIVNSGRTVAAGTTTSTKFTLTPDNSWAPTSTLVVYYINTSGKLISDILVLSVQYVLNNKVTLSWSKQQALPSETVGLTITVAEPNSRVGIWIADSSALLLSNDFNAGNVLNTMMRFNSAPYTDLNNPFTSKYLNSSCQTDATVPSFEDPFYDQYPLEEMGQAISSSQLTTTVFPNTWIWQSVSTGSATTTTLSLTLPDASTTWVAYAFVLSSKLGFGWTTEVAQIKTFQSFKMALNIPYTVTSGEQVVIEVVVFNTLQSTIVVILELQTSTAFTVLGQSNANSAQNKYQTSVPSLSSKSVFFPIKPSQIGEIPIKVTGTSAGTTVSATGSINVKAVGIPKSFSVSSLLTVENSIQTSYMNFTFPSNTVSGSEQVSVSVIGDVMGPSISGLDSLIQMPYGCGEQNMINFAPSVCTLQYLTTVDQVTSNVKDRAMSAISTGYQRELTYLRSDSSFSAFGQYDYSGSTWLSAFVIKCFLQARAFLTIDSSVLSGTIAWLLKFRRNTGEFWEPGRVIHSELKGGAESTVTLTAYILIAVTEQPDYASRYQSTLQATTQYLENQLASIKDNTYSLAIVTYALTLVNSTKANYAFYLLTLKATKQGDLMYWSATPVYLNYWYPRSVDIEATGYALLANMKLFAVTNGTSIMKWLSQQRSHLGGFMSTQDTVIAIQALSQFAALKKTSPGSVTITVKQPTTSSQLQFTITTANMMQLQTKQVVFQKPLNISATAQGTGMALVQLNVFYTVTSLTGSRKRRDTSSTDVFNLHITVVDDPSNVDQLTVEACTSLIPQANYTETGMALMIVTLPSGFVMSAAGINQTDVIPKVERQNSTVNIYLYSINATEVCVSVPAVRQSNVANAQDAYISVCDYYDPSKVSTKTYNSPVLQKIDPCQFCGVNCTLCKSNVALTTPAPSTTTAARSAVPPASGSASVHLPTGIFYVLLVVVTNLR